MNSHFQLALFALASYLIGAIPFGLLISLSKGIDIRKVGSCNIGATNVLRSVGKPWGIATFVADALKGFGPAFFFPRWLPGADPAVAGIVCGFSAILGHNFPVYLNFKGGKGVATSAGAVLGIAPLAVAIGGITWALLFFTTRYVSLASIGICIVVPIASWFIYRNQGPLLPSALTALAILVVWRHKANIQRLLNGTEHRFQKKTTNEHE